MIKYAWFIIVLQFGLTKITGQIIPNAGFEIWTLSPTGWGKNPENWSTSNAYNTGGDTAVNKSTDSYSGNYSAQINTLLLGATSQPYAGFLVNGFVDIDAGDVFLHNYDIMAAGTPIFFNAGNCKRVLQIQFIDRW